MTASAAEWRQHNLNEGFVCVNDFHNGEPTNAKINLRERAAAKIKETV